MATLRGPGLGGGVCRRTTALRSSFEIVCQHPGQSVTYLTPLLKKFTAAHKDEVLFVMWAEPPCGFEGSP